MHTIDEEAKTTMETMMTYIVVTHLLTPHIDLVSALAIATEIS